MYKILINNRFEIEYFEYGSGPELLFAFNGYGRQADEFEGLTPYIAEKYTIIAINLLYHGNSIYLGKHLPTFSEIDFRELITSLLNKYNRKRFSLLGYSMGGRLSLYCIHHFNSIINRAYLFAPDGVKMSGWYKFSSGTFLGQWIMRLLVVRGGLFFNLSKLVKNLGLMSEKKYRFVVAQMETLEKRQKVYDTWVAYRKLNVNLYKLQLNNVELRVFFGKYDKIIPAHWAKALHKKVSKPVHIDLLESGHYMNAELIGRVLSGKL